MSKQWRILYLNLVSLSIILFSYQTKAFVVCIIPDFPFDICPYPNATSDYLTTDVFGFDVDVFRHVAGLTGWVEDLTAASAPPESGRFVFRCLYNFLWGQVTTSMTTPTQTTFDHCAAALGDFTFSTARLQAGDQFSLPYMSSGMAIMVRIEKEAYDWWAFINPFDGMVWLCYGLFVLIVPSCVWFIERLNTVGYISLSLDSMVEWKDSTYQTLLAVFNIALLKVHSFPSQILIIVFLFTNLIVVATYTANLAAAFTSGNYFTTSLTDSSQLFGATVGTYQSYVERIQNHFGAAVIPFDGSSASDILSAMAYMRNGTMAAYLDDRTLLQRLLPLYDTECEFLLLDGVVEPFSYGFMFHELFNSTVIRQFSIGVVAATQDDTISDLQAKYMPSYSTCAVTTSNSLMLQQLAGLFIILAGTVALSALITAFSIFLRIRAVIRTESGDMCETGKMTASPKPSFGEVLKDVFISANREHNFVPLSSKRPRANSISIAGRSFNRSSKVNPDFTSSNSLAFNAFNHSSPPAVSTRNSIAEQSSRDQQLASIVSMPGRYVSSGKAPQTVLGGSPLSARSSIDQSSLAGRSTAGNAVNTVTRTVNLQEQPSEDSNSILGAPLSMSQGTAPTGVECPICPAVADERNIQLLFQANNVSE